jgi:hypothetical protein
VEQLYDVDLVTGFPDASLARADAWKTVAIALPRDVAMKLAEDLVAVFDGIGYSAEAAVYDPRSDLYIEAIGN